MKADRAKDLPRLCIEPVEPRLLLATTVLSFGDGGAHGAIQVTVDPYGAFGGNTGAGDALYTPPNGQAVGTVFESAIYFAPADRFLSSVGIGGIENLPEIAFDEVGLFATSSFVVGGFHVFLTQTPASMSFGGRLTQEYQIRNEGTSYRDLSIVRHVNTDVQAATGAAKGSAAGDREIAGLVFNEELVASGLMVYADPIVGEAPYHLSIFNSVQRGAPGDGYPDATTATSYAAGTAAGGFADILAADGIPPEKLNSIEGDADGNGVADAPYDVSLSLQSEFFAVAPGETVVVKCFTDFDAFVPAETPAPLPGGGAPPTATMAPVPRITDLDKTEVMLVVHYDDDTGVDLSTLDDNDIKVQFGASHRVTFVGAARSPDGRGLVTTYRFVFPVALRPASISSITGQGTYRAWVVPGEVTDTSGNSVFPGALPGGTFVARASTPPTVESDLVAGPIELTGRIPLGGFVAGGKAPGARLTVSSAGGTRFVRKVELALIASLDPAVARGNVELGRLPVKVNLPPGGRRGYRVRPMALPASMAAGDYFLVARLDLGSGSQVTGAPFRSAVSAGTLRVDPPFIDIGLPGPLVGPRPPLLAGRTTRLSVPVRNSGNVVANVPVSARLFASSDRAVGGDDRLLQTLSTKLRLKPGQTRVAKFRFTVPADLPPGDYFLVLLLDPHPSVSLNEATAFSEAAITVRALN